MNQPFIKKIFRALQYKNYRLFFWGQAVSLIGTWMQQMTIIWLIYRLTNSPVMVGLTGFLSLIPTLFISPLGGVLSDRFDKRKLLILTQFNFFLISLIMAGLVFWQSKNVLAYLSLTTLMGIFSALDMPARQSFFFDLIDNKKDIANAVALNSVSFHGARLIGPSLAGILIHFYGESICFLLNSLSYLPVLYSLYLIKPKKLNNPIKSDGTITKALKYVNKNLSLKALLFLITLLSLFGMTYTVLLPIFVREIFQGNSSLLGILMSIAGIGSFSGAIYIASKETIDNLPVLMGWMGLSLGTALLLMAYSSLVPLTGVLLILVGFSMMTMLGGSNVIIQTIVEQKYRGRVISFYAMAFSGMIPLGNLLAGFLAKHIGPQNTLALFGLICFISTLFFRPHIQHIKEKIKLANTLMPEIIE